jgi:hypothetical protein
MFYFTTIKKEIFGEKQITLLLHEFNKNSKFIKDCYRIILFEKNNVVFEKKIQCEKYSLDMALKVYENLKNSLMVKIS